MSDRRQLPEVRSQSKRSLSDYFSGPTILWAALWGAIFGALFPYVPKFIKSRWIKLSGGKQYLLLSVSFFGGCIALFATIGWIASLFLGWQGLLLVVPLVLLLQGPNGTSTSPIRRFEYKYLTVRCLWRDIRTRTCRKCGHYDDRRRWTTKPASDYFESAFAHCERCQSVEFDLHMLDYKPPILKPQHH